MNSSIDLHSIQESITTFFRRFHTILFFLLVSVGLFVAILTLLQIIEVSSSVGNNQQNTLSSDFDTETITRLNGLGNRSPSQPGNRPSPFIEP